MAKLIFSFDNNFVYGNTLVFVLKLNFDTVNRCRHLCLSYSFFKQSCLLPFAVSGGEDKNRRFVINTAVLGVMDEKPAGNDLKQGTLSRFVINDSKRLSFFRCGSRNKRIGVAAVDRVFGPSVVGESDIAFNGRVDFGLQFFARRRLGELDADGSKNRSQCVQPRFEVLKVFSIFFCFADNVNVFLTFSATILSFIYVCS